MIGKSLIRILLISEPVEIDGCYWSKERLAAQLRSSDDSPVRSHSTGASPANGSQSSSSSKLKGFFSGLTRLGSSGATPSPAESPQKQVKASPTGSAAKSAKDVFLQKIQNAPGSNSIGPVRFPCYSDLFSVLHAAIIDIVNSIKRFLSNFRAKPPVPEEQGKLVRRFIDETVQQILAHKLWRGASDEDIDAASEWIEKYAMTKIFNWFAIFRTYYGLLLTFGLLLLCAAASLQLSMILSGTKLFIVECSIFTLYRPIISISLRSIEITPNLIWPSRSCEKSINTRLPGTR